MSYTSTHSYSVEVFSSSKEKTDNFNIEVEPDQNIIRIIYDTLRWNTFIKIMKDYDDEFICIDDMLIFINNKKIRLHTPKDKIDSLYKLECAIIPDSMISKEFEILSIVKNKKIKCDGCVNERMGQNDHMECPYGCLHDRTVCELCK